MWGSPVTITDSQLVIPQPEWKALAAEAQQDASFAVQLQGTCSEERLNTSTAGMRERGRQEARAGESMGGLRGGVEACLKGGLIVRVWFRCNNAGSGGRGTAGCIVVVQLPRYVLSVKIVVRAASAGLLSLTPDCLIPA